MATLRTIGLLCLLTASGVEAQEAARAGIAAWDTGTSSAEPLSAAAVENKAGWAKVEGALKTGELKGDLAVTNGRLIVVARRKGSGLELYSLKSGKPIYRSRLLPAAVGMIESLALTELGRGAAVLELGWKGVSAKFRLPRGETFVESEALTGDASTAPDASSSFPTSSRTTSSSTRAVSLSIASNCPVKTSCCTSPARTTRSSWASSRTATRTSG